MNVHGPRRNVLLLGCNAFQDVLQSIMDDIWWNTTLVSDYNDSRLVGCCRLNATQKRIL